MDDMVFNVVCMVLVIGGAVVKVVKGFQGCFCDPRYLRTGYSGLYYSFQGCLYGFSGLEVW